MQYYSGAPRLSGLMQDRALTTDMFIEHARRWHGRREVVSRLADGTTQRRTYADIHSDAARLSNALVASGIEQGDRVATLAMNGGAHLAAWYGISGIGAVCHTLNPRIFVDQLRYIINHAGDRIIIADGAFAGLLRETLAECPAVERVVFLSSPNIPLAIPNCLLDEFMSGQPETCAWGDFDERAAAGMCYTSGTTGNPKGVLYSHRSNVLHTLTSLQPDIFDLKQHDVILPIVPMYHANAWGLTFSAPAVGAKLVLPGAQLDGDSLYDLIATEGITFAAGVPTVWAALLSRIRADSRGTCALKRVLIGGSAPPERLIREFHELGIDARGGWGMTEMSPVGTICALTSDIEMLAFEEQIRIRFKQGRPPVGIDLRLVDEAGKVLPHDGKTMGMLQARGATVVKEYFGAGLSALTKDQFFDTGDIATIDEFGFMQITDRAKDLIKSGGEWISSLDVENAALLHPKAELVAVIGRTHPKWDERPVLFVKLKASETATEEEFRAHFEGRIAKWWIPDAVIFLDEIPLGATGKVDKKALREAML